LVLVIENFERLPMQPGSFFSRLDQTLLPFLPPSHAVICISNQAPNFGLEFWAQFPRDARILFDLPDEGAIIDRLRWNFESFAAHCQGIPELAGIELSLTEEDYNWLSTFAPSHVMGDVDEFCQRVPKVIFIFVFFSC
jgi:hypothetical protein